MNWKRVITMVSLGLLLGIAACQAVATPLPDLPDGTSTGHKVFCLIARASLGTSKDYGAVNVTG